MADAFTKRINQRLPAELEVWGWPLEGAGITLCWWSLIRELHPAMIDNHEVCEVEFFAGNGDTIAGVSVPTTALRSATRQDIIHLPSRKYGFGRLYPK